MTKIGGAGTPAHRLPTPGRTGTRGLVLAAGILSLFLPATGAAALDEPAGEWDNLKSCEKRLCTMILKQEPTGDDLTCPLAKTWPKTTLNGGEGKLVKWGFGDARCAVDLNITRAKLIGALTTPAYALEVPEHKVTCDVESNGEVKKVRMKLAPRIEFKSGRASKVWINLKDVSGPAGIKATVWTAAKLEDSFGIFHKNMIKSINKFMTKRCVENYGPWSEETKGAGPPKSPAQPANDKGAKPEPAKPDAKAASE